ncbi:MAG: discoidin domain-containing protein, partial [Candidatus Hydrogenedentes bacterium]|nr:discoidin domain-containing protein [Candidatus Hydrogenedentota bacterium]
MTALLVSFAVFAAEQEPLSPVPAFTVPRIEPVTASVMREQIEADWLLGIRAPLTTASDAAGGCDGVKNGTYGFHVGLQANPWWQVDLGGAVQAGRVVVYNRLDYAPGLHNADRLQMFGSLDGKTWTLFHDNQGQHFGGVSGAPPLEVVLGPQGITARYIRIAIPSTEPLFFHLDEVEVYGTGAAATNLALGKQADQSSLSPWSTVKVPGPPEYPTSRHIERARRFAASLRAQGVDVTAHLRQVNEAEQRLKDMPPNAPEEARRALYLDTRWIVRRLVFRNPRLDFDQLLFIKRFTQETYPDVCLNHMPWVSRPGGDICVLEPATADDSLFAALSRPPAETPQQPVATLRTLLNGALGPGHVHGLDLWFQGNRVVFGYARARSENPPEGWLDRTQSYRLRRTEEPVHIFELHIGDGALRQLTSGEWSDLDPAYAPNGDIVFVSERCGTSLQCNEYDKDETSCNLYVMRPDGSGIRRLSVNKDGDYLPHCLDNGMIAYTRWEYHERSWAFIQSLWVIRPDGTGADAIFKQHFVNPWALEDVRSIPGSTRLVAIAAGHHTLAAGPLVIVNHDMGVNEPRGIGIVTPHLMPPEGGMDGVPVPEGGTDDHEGFYGTPWALSESCFLACYTYGSKTTEPAGYGLYLVDVYGNKELIYRDPDISCFYPIPLRPRPQPPILPETTDPAKSYATCCVSNIAMGSEEIPAERVRYLRVAQPIGWPYDNHNGGQRYGEDHRYGGPDADRKNLTNWTPVRILGDVPVAPDGSAHFIVPADTAVYFQLL